MCSIAPEIERNPERTLSTLIEDDLGVKIDPQALRVFLRCRWSRIATLAHGIHSPVPAENGAQSDYSAQVGGAK